MTIREAAVELVRFWCGESGRVVSDDVYREVTEGRQDAALRAGSFYSSCGDLGHCLLFALGCREHWINRDEHEGWAPIVNVSRLCRWGPGTNRLARDVTSETPLLPGDVLVLAAFSPSLTHVCVVVEDRGDELVTADYGQAERNPQPSIIGGQLRKRRKSVSSGRVVLTDQWSARSIDSILSPIDAVQASRDCDRAGPMEDVEAWLARVGLRPPSTQPAPPPHDFGDAGQSPRPHRDWPASAELPQPTAVTRAGSSCSRSPTSSRCSCTPTTTSMRCGRPCPGANAPGCGSLRRGGGSWRGSGTGQLGGASDDTGGLPVANDDLRAAIVATARGELCSTDWRRYVDAMWPGYVGDRPHWCGIFYLWCLEQVAPSGRRWAMGKGISPALPTIRVDDARPGDGLYMAAHNHHAAFVRRDGDYIVSIDGNTMGDFDGDGVTDSFSCVFERRRKATDWAVALDAAPAIAAAKPSQPVVTGLPMPIITGTSKVVSPAWEPIQRELRAYGYTGPIDGWPGRSTLAAALREWEAKR